MTIKRIMKDITALSKHPLTSHGIYTINDEDVLRTVYVLMIGPENTPYEDGFFFFQIDLPDNYPINPPKVKYLTQGDQIRFNPNLYISGKVCLSIINTWSGPGWSPCNTLSSVLISIKALVLIDNPLLNEPGFESASNAKLKPYNEIIRHESLRTGVLGMMKKLPSIKFNPFIPIMEKHICNNISKIIDRIDNLSILHDGKKYSSTYGLNLEPFYAKLKIDLIELYNKINNTGATIQDVLTEKNQQLTIKIPLKNNPPVKKNQHLLDKQLVIKPLTMKDNLLKMRKVAINLGINVKKKSTKSGKMINKSKSELLLEICQKQVHASNGK